MMFTSRVIDTLQIKYPIIQAGMAGAITTPELVAAVSNSGGLGTLGAGYMSPEQIREAIYKIRERTDKPFGVNLLLTKEIQIEEEKINLAKGLLSGVNREFGIEEEEQLKLPKSYKEQLQVLVEENVPVVSFAFQTLEKEEINDLKRSGIKVIGTATHVAEAKVLAELGVDIIVGQGSEAGGHRGTFIGKEQDAMIGTFALIPQLVAAVIRYSNFSGAPAPRSSSMERPENMPRSRSRIFEHEYEHGVSTSRKVAISVRLRKRTLKDRRHPHPCPRRSYARRPAVRSEWGSTTIAQLPPACPRATACASHKSDRLIPGVAR